MMELTGERITATVPPGWDVRIGSDSPATPGAAPFVHAANFPLPERRGSFGGGVYELMGPGHVFIAFLEYPSEAGSAMFTLGRFPRRLDSQTFSPNAGHGLQPGQMALQRFFTEEGRAFCLYVVLGSEAGRPALLPLVNAYLAGLRVQRPEAATGPGILPLPSRPPGPDQPPSSPRPTVLPPPPASATSTTSIP